MDPRHLPQNQTSPQFGKKVSAQRPPAAVRSGASQAFTSQSDWSHGQKQRANQAHVSATGFQADGYGGLSLGHPPSPIQYFLQAFTKRAFDFQGRAGRKEYWWFTLFHVLIFIILMVVGYTIDISMDAPDPSTTIGLIIAYALISLIPKISLNVRRMHDLDVTGWVYMAINIPTAGLGIVWGFAARPGTPGANKYGPSPNQSDDAAAIDAVFA